MADLVEERNGAETIADVIDALCVKRAEWQQRAETAERDLEDEQAHAGRTQTALVRSQEELAKLRRDVTQLNESAERALRNLARLNQIMLDLYHYIVELAGHRDTAKTKAERVALGHVVERLKQIRGWEEETE